MEIEIKKPFFPYQEDYNIEVNGAQVGAITVCESISIYNNKILKINSPSGLYPEKYLNVKNVEYTFEFQDISVTRNWKIYKGKDLKRIYKITFLVKDFPFPLFVKLNIWEELRLKWFWGKWRIWLKEPENKWKIFVFFVSPIVGFLAGYYFR